MKDIRPIYFAAIMALMIAGSILFANGETEAANYMLLSVIAINTVRG